MIKMDLAAIGAIAIAVYNIWKYIPKWKSLDYSTKSMVRLSIIVAAVLFVGSIVLHLSP